jgi:hypothetical protein
LTAKEFIAQQIEEISRQEVKIFPGDFLFSCETDSVTLPSAALIIGNEFFGGYEVLTIKGDLFLHTDTLLKAKYLVYSSRLKDRAIKIPLDIKYIEAIVKNYEAYLDTVLKSIEKDYKMSFPGSKDLNTISNEIFRLLNLKRL